MNCRWEKRRRSLRNHRGRMQEAASRSRASESACVAFCRGYGIDFGELHFHSPDNPQLSNSIAGFYSKKFFAQVDQNNFQLAAVAGIDHAGQRADSLQSQSGAILDERAEFRGKLESETGANGLDFAGRQFCCLQSRNIGGQIAEGASMRVAWLESRWVQLGEVYVDLHLSAFLQFRAF